MKIKLYTKYHDESLLKKFNQEEIFTSEEHAYILEKEFGKEYETRAALLQHFMRLCYEKLPFLVFLIKYIYENKFKSVISLGSSVGVFEYLLKLAMPENSTVVAADFDAFVIRKTRQFFPEIIAEEFDFFKDKFEDLNKKLNINFDLAFFLASAYVMDDDIFVKQFNALKKTGIKNVIDFHAGYITNKECLEISCSNLRSSITGGFKKIKIINDLWRKFRPLAQTGGFKGKFHGYGRTRDELRKLYKKAGFDLVKEQRVSNYKYVAILKCD